MASSTSPLTQTEPVPTADQESQHLSRDRDEPHPAEGAGAARTRGDRQDPRQHRREGEGHGGGDETRGGEGVESRGPGEDRSGVVHLTLSYLSLCWSWEDWGEVRVEEGYAYEGERRGGTS